MNESKMKTDLCLQAEVVVCGGGPAGVCAAIAAARGGVKTLLIERAGALGGIWTTGLLSWILDCTNKNGILREMMSRLEKDGHGRFARDNNFLAEPEWVKLTLEEMCLQAGVEVLLYSQICAVELTEEKKICAVRCQSKAGELRVSGEIFIDATGDGDVAALAGCEFAYGNDGRSQPMSLIALVDGLDPEKAKFIDNAEPAENPVAARNNLKAEMQAVGITPSYQYPSLWHINDGLWIMMTQHEYEVSPFDPRELTKATLHARQELARQVSALRAGGGVWEKLRLVTTAQYIGVRESRRVVGQYTVTDRDVFTGARFDDAVCEVTYHIDIHPTGKDRSFKDEMGSMRSKPYQIPRRAMIARDVSGLLLAGRCISGTYVAHACYRMTGNAAAIGEAAGEYAATLVK